MFLFPWLAGMFFSKTEKKQEMALRVHIFSQTQQRFCVLAKYLLITRV
jgi:hypothetical protein